MIWELLTTVKPFIPFTSTELVLLVASGLVASYIDVVKPQNMFLSHLPFQQTIKVFRKLKLPYLHGLPKPLKRLLEQCLYLRYVKRPGFETIQETFIKVVSLLKLLNSFNFFKCFSYLTSGLCLQFSSFR